MKWHKFIQRCQTLLRCEYPIFFGSQYLAEHPELFETGNLLLQCWWLLLKRLVQRFSPKFYEDSLKSLKQQFMLSFSPKSNLPDIKLCHLLLIKSWHIDTDEKTSQKQKLTLVITKSCWSPRYIVSVLSTCGGYHPEGLIVVRFCNLKHIANNHYNNNKW